MPALFQSGVEVAVARPSQSEAGGALCRQGAHGRLGRWEEVLNVASTATLPSRSKCRDRALDAGGQIDTIGNSTACQFFAVDSLRQWYISSPK